MMKQLPKHILCTAVVLVYGAALINVSAEDYISPELIRVSTENPPRFNQFSPNSGTYKYSVGWEGISAASCSVIVDNESDKLKVSAIAKTYSAIDLFYKLRYSAEAILSPRIFTPKSLVIDHHENSKHRQIEIDYLKNGTVKSVRTQQDGSAAKVLSFAPQNSMFEPMSAAFLARGIDWQVGSQYSFDVFNGKSRYLITLECLKKEVIEHLGKQRATFVISPRVRTLTTTKANEKLRSARIYLSDDSARDILRLESSVFIGRVITELDSFEPASSKQQLAANF